jgi:hypothetical protein
MNLGLRWGDVAVVMIAAALVASSFALTYAPASGALLLVVSQAGEAARYFPLDEDRKVEIAGPAGLTEVEIHRGRARCLRSPGSQGICERAGWLERDGDMAVSLPNRLVLQLQGSGAPFDSMHF